MNINGVRTITASQQVVWDALNDPDILRSCIPGCDEMERVSDNEYWLGMLAVVGPVKARFTGKLLLSDIVAPERYALRFEGSGGAAGFGKGMANVVLSADEDAQTQLTYTANAQIGGKIAQVGSRLVDGIARKIAEEFFTRFEARLNSVKEAETTATEAQTDGVGASTTTQAQTPANSLVSAPLPPPQRSGRRLIGWAIGIAVAVAAIAALVLQHSS
jgi:carbon monoxide dehydrogenase subunit G